MAGHTRELGETGRRVGRQCPAPCGTPRGLSTDGLAEMLQAAGWPIQQSGLTRIERGERHVDADDLDAIARALGVTAGQLLYGSDVSAEVSITIPGRRT